MKNRLTKKIKNIHFTSNMIKPILRYAYKYIIHGGRFVMESRIAYRIDFAKAIELVVWVANKKPSIDIYHLAKILYYAEKYHLNKYARPIIGDTYIAMEYGNVPSGIRDLITKNSWLDPNYIKTFSDSVRVGETPYPNVTPLRSADLSFFSQSDIECLEESLNQYADISFDELKITNHKERSWSETELNQPIDYALMVDNDNPNKDEILGELGDTANYVRM